jgi:hypothetical protein
MSAVVSSVTWLMPRRFALGLTLALLSSVSKPGAAEPKPREPFYRRAASKLGPDYELRSGVGPIASFLKHEDEIVEGVGGFSLRQIVVHFEGAYRFDLLQYLVQSGQDGGLRAALTRLADAMENGGRETTAAPLRLASLPEIQARLAAATCRPSDLQSFWIDWFDGTGKVALVVEACAPEMRRSAWSPPTAFICIQAPPEWLPWLAQADGDQAVLGAQVETWQTSLSKRAMLDAQRTLARLPRARRRSWIRRHVAPHAPRSAAQLLTEALPWPDTGKLDREAQLAGAERLELLRLLGDVHGCSAAAAPFFEREVRRETAVAVVSSLSRCLTIGSSGSELAACRAASDPLACAKPIFESARAEAARLLPASPALPPGSCPDAPSAYLD